MKKRIVAFLLACTLACSSITASAEDIILSDELEEVQQEVDEEVTEEVDEEEATEEVVNEMAEEVVEAVMDDETAELVQEYRSILDSAIAVYASGNLYETELAKFPTDYQKLLKELHKKYPNWIFKAVDTGIEWDDVVSGESYGTRSLTNISYSDILLSKDSGDYDVSTGKYIPKDGSTWVNVSDPGVAYFVDPRNYLYEESIFAMEYQGYDANCHTLAGIEAILKKTDLAETEIVYTNTSGKKVTVSPAITYGEAILAAGISNSISPLSLAARIKQETGGSLSYGSISGTYSYQGTSYQGYYNYYNIGATADTTKPPLVNGLNYAKTQKWTSPLLAIDGGAKFLAQNYISKGQNTVYFQKFNTVYKPYYSHQYMQNITAPMSEARTTFYSYSASELQSQFVFYIPVYKNMPSLTAGIKINKNVSTAKTTWDLSLRNGPATSYTKVTTIPAGATITVSGGVFTDNDVAYGQKLQNPYWMKVTYETSAGKKYSGYVSSNYIEMDTAVTVKVGKSYSLTLSEAPSGENIYYETSDPAIATVDSNGVVKGIAAGSCMIYAVTSSGQALDAIGITISKTDVAPDVPTLSSVKNSNSGVTITWMQAANADGYYVYRKTSSGSWKKLTQISSGTTTSYVDTTASSGTTYSYTVSAYSGSKSSSYNSSGLSILRLSQPTVTISSTTSNSVKLGWTKVTGAKGYYVYRRSGTSGSWTQIANIKSGTTLTYTNSSLTAATKYYYTVKAYNGSTYSSYLTSGVLATTKSITYTTYKTTMKVNYRTGAGTSYSKGGSLAKGTNVQVEDGYSKKANGYTWYRVKINSKNYYIASEYLTKVTNTSTTKTYTTYQTTETVNYRTGAGTSYSKGGSLAKGTKVQVEDGYSKSANGYTWYRVKINSKNYYIASKYLTKVTSTSTTKTYTTYQTTETVNYRTGAGTSYSKGGSLAKGTKVQVENGYSKSANGYTWYRVKINSKNYYIASKYLKKV